MTTSFQGSPKTKRKLPSAAGGLSFRHILVPVDFSGFSRQALMCAVPLARQYRARISLVHVVQPPVPMVTFPDGGGVAMPVNMGNVTVGNINQIAKIKLDDWAVRLLPAAVRGQTVIRQGGAANEVVAVAKALKADLIVLSNTGRSGLSHVLLGSTAEKIVRHAHCPVLTVRRQGGKASAQMLSPGKPNYPKRLPWRRILAPLDFSRLSMRVLNVVVPLAKESAASLVLLHVVEPNPYPSGMDGGILVVPDPTVARDARKRLLSIVAHYIPKSIRLTTLVKLGRAADVIVETAEKKNIDLIVISTHGHTGLERLLMGSVAELVVRQARCPVLVVRQPKI